MQALVIDTNVALDLLVFQDAGAAPLREALAQGRGQWLATPPMRAELARVLGYAHIARRLGQRGQAAAEVLAAFDAQACLQPVPAKAPVTCRDPDDQMFIDLAVAHRAHLFSKDRAVLCMRKRLARLDVIAWPAMQSVASAI